MTGRAQDVLTWQYLQWLETYKTVKLMERGQHVSWPFMCAIQRDHVWVAEVVGFMIVDSYIASCL
jgi:hypothetical protein